ncbi:LacI family DNA-binding transcriptional regulator [Sphingomicrobium sediminis]|uniref:LacI family DNA-binding transcriptional regulator n=1 Tax=Sphingomicrobium sediminis TaxID=2950949 RepID=A0A9X2ELY6_9SPHN|nr:LacI family DNA-binding transcriptional regulator [Sphingomicrobium sediminis]MCM8557804.1 LacI family DNA-binding transcriptional regulator [Sphingomicrobium sediminis]
MKKQAITIEDVARAASVSRQTVSRVINRMPSVSAKARERVESAIAQLGYSPNLAARRMGGARSFLIMAINDRARTIENWAAGRGNDWVDQMLYGGMMACEARGYHMLFELVDTDQEEAVRQVRRVLSSLQPDGIILTQPHSQNAALVEMLKEQGKPYARIDLPSDNIDGVSIHMNEESAAESATRYLIGLGHERIGFLAGSAEYAGSHFRKDGYLEAMDSAGLEPLLDSADFSFDRAADMARLWLGRQARPTAIIAENDEMAFAVLHVADELGIEVPKHLSVISFEDTPGVRFSVPPLTAIRQPTAAMIARACEILMDAAEGEESNDETVLPFQLIKRETTGPAPR